jgi:hypothetical protein
MTRAASALTRSLWRTAGRSGRISRMCAGSGWTWEPWRVTQAVRELDEQLAAVGGA